MSAPKPVPKRNRALALFLLVFLVGTATAAYLAWTRVSALMVLRWFVEETGIPVEVRAASWSVSFHDLRERSIKDLHLEVFYKPLNAFVTLDTPAHYDHAGAHWSIQLEPRLRINELPPTSGKLALELDVKRNGRKALAERASVEFHLHELEPLKLAAAVGEVRAERWRLDGWVQWAGAWTSQVEVRAENVSAHDRDSKHVLTVKALDLETDTAWPARLPLPLSTNAKVKLESPQLMAEGLFIDEPRLEAETSFRFDGHRFDKVDISVDNPLRLRAQGELADDGSAKASFNLRGDLDELVTERAARWLEGQVPLLHRAKAKGALKLGGRFSIDRRHGPRGTAQLDVDAQSIELPSRDLYADGLKLRAPLEYPGTPDFGSLAIKTVEFHSVKLKNLVIATRLAASGIDVTTEDENGDDRPIRQSVWGGAIDISKLYAHVGGEEGTEFTAAVSGGPFQIPAVQSDLCLMPQHPLKGQLSFTYPQIVLDHDSIALVGDTNLNVFNGAAHVGDMRLAFDERNPKLSLDIDWSDLDLHAIGEWSSFGDMRGSLEGSLRNAKIALTPVGPVPLAYQFAVRGQQRGGNAIRFYGRAIDNVVSMLSGGKNLMEQIPDGAFFLKWEVALGKLWRNWLPATAHYMGFAARTDGDWTELSTFDPEDEPCDPAHPEKHFLLCGTAFNIPLNTHGVYPVIMKTDAFQGWLAGMVDYFKRSFGNGKKQTDDSGCTPLW